MTTKDSPMHLECPNCHEDIDSGGWCENRYDELNFLWSHYKWEHPADPYYAEVSKELMEIQSEI